MYFLSRDVIRYTIPPSHEKKFYNRFTFIKTEIVIGTTPIPAFLPLDGHVIIGISKKKMSLKYVKSNLFRIDMNISRPSGFISRWSFFIYTQPQNHQKGGITHGLLHRHDVSEHLHFPARRWAELYRRIPAVYIGLHNNRHGHRRLAFPQKPLTF